MNSKKISFIITFFLFLFAACTKETNREHRKPSLSNFSLTDQAGTNYHLYDFKSYNAVVFISQINDCPINQKYSQTINELAQKFQTKNVKIFYINSSLNDDLATIKEEAKNYNFQLPILIDDSQSIAKLLEITRSSEAIIITPKNWNIVFRGAISDRLDYGADKQAASKNYLEDALKNTLEEKYDQIKSIPAKGCLFTFNSDKYSYQKVVRPLLSNKCLSCHSEPNKNNFSLKSFKNIYDQKDVIKSILLLNHEIHIIDDKNKLNPSEKNIILSWINDGALDDTAHETIKK